LPKKQGISTDFKGPEKKERGRDPVPQKGRKMTRVQTMGNKQNFFSQQGSSHSFIILDRNRYRRSGRYRMAGGGEGRWPKLPAGERSGRRPGGLSDFCPHGRERGKELVAEKEMLLSSSLLPRGKKTGPPAVLLIRVDPSLLSNHQKLYSGKRVKKSSYQLLRRRREKRAAARGGLSRLRANLPPVVQKKTSPFEL